MFDPISWGLGFRASKSTEKLINTMFPSELRNTLLKVTRQWSDSLPTEIHTVPEALLTSGESGPCREKLQMRLYQHNQVPDETLWNDALCEAWQEKKVEWGDNGNGFFRLSREQAEVHLQKLAHELSLACVKEKDLFQVSALHQLGELLANSELLHEEMCRTQSVILSKLHEIVAFRPQLVYRKAITRLFEHPDQCDGRGLMELNSMVLVDEPSSVVSGQIRKSQSWIGINGAPIEEASFVPPPPDHLSRLFADFVGRWSDKPSSLESKDTRVVIRGMAQFHHELVSLHPFEDGNGRVARVLTDCQAQHLLLHSGRLCLMSDPRYVSALKCADQGDIEQFVDLLASKLA